LFVKISTNVLQTAVFTSDYLSLAGEFKMPKCFC